ncbi:MAG: RidA family protein [Desulfuromonadales bacterium]
MTIKRHGSVQTGAGGTKLPFAKAVEANGWLYVSGQVAMVDGQVTQGGIVPQSHQAIQNLIGILKDTGYSVNDVVRVGVWLDDARDFAAFNAVYVEYFGDNPPARACVQSSMMIDCKVEIDCVAYQAEKSIIR